MFGGHFEKPSQEAPYIVIMHEMMGEDAGRAAVLGGVQDAGGGLGEKNIVVTATAAAVPVDHVDMGVQAGRQGAFLRAENGQGAISEAGQLLHDTGIYAVPWRHEHRYQAPTMQVVEFIQPGLQLIENDGRIAM
ncbi:hypothetical protein D3C86_1531010 [compost metagenome]